MANVKRFGNRHVQGLLRFILGYCDKSNIHGVCYFSKRGLHWSERLFWIIACGVSLLLCGLMSHNIWIKWHTNPVYMSLSEKPVPISTIPFPTITICLENKTPPPTLKKTDIADISDILQSLTNNSHEMKNKLNALLHVCPRLAEKFKSDDNFTDGTIYEMLSSISKKALRFAFVCWWQRNLKSPCLYLDETFTEEGVCYTFNYLNTFDMFSGEMASKKNIMNNTRAMNNWNLESGYNTFHGDEYPLRVFDSGQGTGLDLMFGSRKFHNKFTCKRYSYGYKIILSLPGEALKISKNAIRVSFAEDVLISIKPKLITTSDKLRNYAPHERQCFYQSERRLRFYKMYTQINCEDECLANFTKAECGCVKFSMPRDNGTRICGAGKIECYNSAEKNFRLSESLKSFRDHCNCLPACTSVEYDVDVDRTNYLERANLQTASLSIFFGNQQVNTKTRMETYSVSDFLAICGGFLGLLLGISVLSVIELIFHSTLRLLCTIRRSRAVEDTLPFTEREQSTLLTRFFSTTRNFFKELCTESSIHGLRYFTDRALHWSERLWWIISVGISLWLCGLLAWNIWMQWCENPVTLVADDEIPISSIPFPTVTICPETKSKVDKYDLCAEAFDQFQHTGLNETKKMRVAALYHMCTLYLYEQEQRNNKYAQNLHKLKLDRFTNESIYVTITDIAPTLNETIKSCLWQNEPFDCSKHIAPVFTDDGLCFTFNALDSHEMYTDQMVPKMKTIKFNQNVSHWNLENGYDTKSYKEEYPIRLFSSGRENALDILLTIRALDIFCPCKNLFNGFRVVFSTPGDILKVSRNSFRISIPEDNRVAIKPKLTTTSNELRGYDAMQRQCFYSSERQLRFYKIYSQFNCEEECLANFTSKECGCVHFAIPRDNSSKICGAAKMKCYKSAEKTLLTNESAMAFRGKCDCLPACTSIHYDVDIDRVAFNETVLRNSTTTLVNNNNEIKLTKLSIFFEDKKVETLKRVATNSFTEFLAFCGGLLGLFLGISYLSIIELIYYVTLRLFWNIRCDRFENTGQ